MLFSNAEVAAAINNSFEPVWESVRPVPIVRIDFGNGQVITRTLHGNIANLVCDAEGQVLDILPGIYEPTAYVRALEQLRIVQSNYRIAGGAKSEKAVKGLRNYHAARAAALAKGEPLARLVDLQKRFAFSKAIIEMPTEWLVKGRADHDEEARAVRAAETAPPKLAGWSALVEDTRLNEKARRQLIHQKLAAGPVAPAQITRWLYKEVLHADLDDPYLGLRETLFANYPFAEEDRN